jgi:hypothetical protein
MSIQFHHYKELKECISEVEQIEATTIKIQEKLQIGQKEEVDLDSYFIDNNSIRIAES